MAIPRGVAALLIEEHLRRPFSGRLLQLGRQHTYVSLLALNKLLKRYAGVAPNFETTS